MFIPRRYNMITVFSGIRVTLFLVFNVVFVEHCLSSCPLSIDRCIVLFLLTTLLSSFYWPLYCPLSIDCCIVGLSFEIWFLNFPFDILILSHTIIESCSPPLYEYLTMASIIGHHSKFSAQIYVVDSISGHVFILFVRISEIDT